jgi:tetratricopeptide (TPR) repeat protein
MYQEAIHEFHRAMDLSGKGPLSVLLVGHAYAVSGKRDEALAVIDQLNELSKQRYFSPYRVALIHAGLDNSDEAFEWLERAYEKSDARLIWLKVDPALDDLRRDPRFQDLLGRIGLSQSVIH